MVMDMSNMRVSSIRTDDFDLREQQEGAVRLAGEEKSSRHLVLKVIGGTLLALAGVTLITSLHDIRRYIRISRM